MGYLKELGIGLDYSGTKAKHVFASHGQPVFEKYLVDRRIQQLSKKDLTSQVEVEQIEAQLLPAEADVELVN
jgi:hypothetical protein